MIKSILFFTLGLFASLSLFSQDVLSIMPENLSAIGSTNDEDVEAHFEVTNILNSSADIYWRLVRGDRFPEGWVTQVCDFNICYPENVDMCSATKPNEFGQNQTFPFTFHLLPNGNAGEGSVCLEFF